MRMRLQQFQQAKDVISRGVSRPLAANAAARENVRAIRNQLRATVQQTCSVPGGRSRNLSTNRLQHAIT
jgi:hypothetical protein